MQVMIRARYVRLSSEEQPTESNEKGTRARKDHKLPKVRPEITYTSMDELLKNSFARQLLESSPKSKAIKIKCDPLRRDSSWVWLERWMSLASPGAVDDRTAGLEKGQEEKNDEKEQEEKISVEDYRFHEENEIFSEAKDKMNCSAGFDYSKMAVIEDTNPMSDKMTNFDEDWFSASSMERQKPDTVGDLEMVEPALEMDSVTRSVDSQHKIDSVNAKPEFETQQTDKFEAEVKPEQAIQMGPADIIVSKSLTECSLPATEGKSKIEKVVSVSESSSLCNSEPELASVPNSATLSDSISIPQNAAAEELISVTNSAILCSDSVSPKAEADELVSVPNLIVNKDSVPQNVEAEELVPHSAEFDMNLETASASSGDDIIINHKEPGQHNLSSIHVGESECGTELSISSTLDSPDRLEIGPMGVESERVDSNDAGSHMPDQSSVVEVEIKTESGSVGKKTSAEYATGVHTGTEEKELETKSSDLQLQAEAEETKPERDPGRSHQASPGVSSRSQVTVTESQGTPSSQVSVSNNTKRAKTEKSGSIKKWTILSTSKKSPRTDASGGKSSAEKPTKDQKSVKIRTSFGSQKHEIVDQEQRRDSISSSSLPSYMQATESARAKANAGHSPRSSPDVADKETFLRKRPSLSGAKDRQESPRLRRTSSQSQSGSKSNGTSPHDRKWQR
uniref:DUF4005 domain-containing protein n=1 Tax=Kalanchoe fedtschenkoi TaxID=63787 RepID=A0A7N0VFC5_KALFE